MLPTTRTGSGFWCNPGRVLPGFGPNRVWKSTARMSPSMISRLSAARLFPQLGGQNAVQFDRNYPAGPPRQQGSQGSAARANLKYGPLRSSPMACTTRWAADSSTRKCCPSLGLLFNRGRAAEPLPR